MRPVLVCVWISYEKHAKREINGWTVRQWEQSSATVRIIITKYVSHIAAAACPNETEKNGKRKATRTSKHSHNYLAKCFSWQCTCLFSTFLSPDDGRHVPLTHTYYVRRRDCTAYTATSSIEFECKFACNKYKRLKILRLFVCAHMYEWPILSMADLLTMLIHNAREYTNVRAMCRKRLLTSSSWPKCLFARISNDYSERAQWVSMPQP